MACSILLYTEKTIIISSHVLSELAEMCTDIGIIDQGRMVLEGNITAILSRVNASNPLVISVYSNIDQSRQTQNPVKKGKDQRKSRASGADFHLTAVNRILPHKTSPPFLLHDLSAA